MSIKKNLEGMKARCEAACKEMVTTEALADFHGNCRYDLPVCIAEIERLWGLEGRRFPIVGQPGRTIPWSVAEKAYEKYSALYGTSQSLTRLAERGGFHINELDALYPDWRKETSEIERLQAESDEQRQFKEGYYDQAADGWAKVRYLQARNAELEGALRQAMTGLVMARDEAHSTVQCETFIAGTLGAIRAVLDASKKYNSKSGGESEIEFIRETGPVTEIVGSGPAVIKKHPGKPTQSRPRPGQPTPPEKDNG